jgi:hypothetical protein
LPWLTERIGISTEALSRDHVNVAASALLAPVAAAAPRWF